MRVGTINGDDQSEDLGDDDQSENPGDARVILGQRKALA